MQTTKNVFGRIWAVWGLLWFVLTMLIFLIPFYLFCYTVPDPLKNRRFIKYSRVWMDVYLFIVGCPLKVRGKENFREGETYIVVCNHNALIDVPVSSPGIPGGNKTIAKSEMASIPLFGVLYKAGAVLVDRKSVKSRQDSFSKMQAVLASGLHMCIYPEGTRNTSDAPLKSFHDGAFRLALLTGRPIIPMVIFNSRRANPPEKGFYLMPVRLYMHFLPEISPGEGETLESLKANVFETMQTYILAHRAAPSR